DDAEVDERDDGDLRIGDLLERLPDLRLGERYHCAPAGAERRTSVISSHSGPRSSACDKLSLGRSSPVRTANSSRSSLGSRPTAYGHSSSTAAWKRGSSRSRSCHIAACMRWYVSSRSIFAARSATAVSPSS